MLRYAFKTRVFNRCLVVDPYKATGRFLGGHAGVKAFIQGRNMLKNALNLLKNYKNQTALAPPKPPCLGDWKFHYL